MLRTAGTVLWKDLRIELLTIFNPFEPTDLGKCGEGPAVDIICLKSFGSMANGLAAIGIVGERRPYDDYEGVERWDFGMRLEGRLDRFTWAVSDFWGWDDGFYLDLVRRHDPARVEDLAVIDSTPWMPIPLLVAAPGIDPAVVDRLREHLLRVHELPGYAALLASVLLARFVAPDVAAYQATERMREAAERAGYAAIR